MKKVLALTLAVLMCLTVASCSVTVSNDAATVPAPNNSNAGVSDSDAESTAPVTNSTANAGAAQKVAEFVAQYRNDILTSFEQGFTSSGMTCTTSIDAVGTGFVVTVKVNELSNVDSATAAQMQQTYDAMQATFDGMLKTFQSELPELTYFTFDICDAYGVKLASIHAGN